MINYTIFILIAIFIFIRFVLSLLTGEKEYPHTIKTKMTSFLI